ncbi:MAG: guanylate kinase [Pseudomonadota bacterium]
MASSKPGSNAQNPTLPIARRGLLFVLSSPSGAGKSTLARALLDGDANLSMSISVTTRAPRPGEVDGADYHFVSEKTFETMVAEKAFLEHASVFSNRYGTPRAPVEAALTAGRDVLFDIDWQGTQQLAQAAAEDLVKVFVLPPSKAVLEQRLRNRAQDSAEVVAQRMAKADSEISHWAEYDYIILNDSLDRSIAQAKAILEAERARLRRLEGLPDFINSLKH